MFKFRAKGTPRRIPGKRNGLEREFEEILKSRVASGELAWYDFEAITFKLGTDCRYTPDFSTMHANGDLVCYETKGYMQEDARVKMKTLVRLFPVRLILVQKRLKRDGGGFSETEIE